LADFGRKEIILAENEMPGLMAMRFFIQLNLSQYVLSILEQSTVLKNR
jgi:S-adenosylhomocysteine hydrolase